MPDDTNERLENIRQREMQKTQRAREEKARRTEMELAAALRWDTEIKPMIQQLQQEINQELVGSAIGLDVKEGSPVPPHVGMTQVFLVRDGKYTQMYLNIILTPVGTIQVTPGDAVPRELTSTEVHEPYRDGLKAAFIDFLGEVIWQPTPRDAPLPARRGQHQTPQEQHHADDKQAKACPEPSPARCRNGALTPLAHLSRDSAAPTSVSTSPAVASRLVLLLLGPPRPFTARLAMRSVLIVASVACFTFAGSIALAIRSDIQIGIILTALIGGFALAGLAAILTKLDNLQNQLNDLLRPR